jgi:hypothetical protein
MLRRAGLLALAALLCWQLFAWLHRYVVAYAYLWPLVLLERTRLQVPASTISLLFCFMFGNGNEKRLNVLAVSPLPFPLPRSRAGGA